MSSYVMPPAEREWPCSSCLRTIEITISSCFLSFVAIIYSTVKHSYKFLLPCIGTILFVIVVVVAINNWFFIDQILKFNGIILSGYFLLFISYCIRLRFRYLIFPFIFKEHFRLLMDVYLIWWKNRIFNRMHLGMDEDDTCFSSYLEIWESFTDLVLCCLVNLVLSIGFLFSTILLVIWYVMCQIFLLLWSVLVLVGFIVYPILFIPDLLLGLLHHLYSLRGGFSLVLLKQLFLGIHKYLRFAYNIRFDVEEWLEDREQYWKLRRLLLFLLYHSALGPRGFVYINNESSLGYYTDQDDGNNYSIVSLSLDEYNSLAIDAALTYIGYGCLFFSTDSDFLNLYGCVALGGVLFCELYVYLLWPRWTPTMSVKFAIYPTLDDKDDPFASSELDTSKPITKGYVSFNDLAY